MAPQCAGGEWGSQGRLERKPKRAPTSGARGTSRAALVRRSNSSRGPCKSWSRSELLAGTAASSAPVQARTLQCWARSEAPTVRFCSRRRSRKKCSVPNCRIRTRCCCWSRPRPPSEVSWGRGFRRGLAGCLERRPRYLSSRRSRPARQIRPQSPRMSRCLRRSSTRCPTQVRFRFARRRHNTSRGQERASSSGAPCGSCCRHDLGSASVAGPFLTSRISDGSAHCSARGTAVLKKIASPFHVLRRRGVANEQMPTLRHRMTTVICASLDLQPRGRVHRLALHDGSLFTSTRTRSPSAYPMHDARSFELRSRPSC
jgi:hypothetical protein